MDVKLILENLAWLLRVKTIVTFAVITVFVVLALRGEIRAETVMQVVTLVIAFYFGTQSERAETQLREQEEQQRVI